MKNAKLSVIVAILVRKGDSYLLVKKPDDVGPYKGTFLLPGGYVEHDGETVDDAVGRELYEETGVTVKGLERKLFDEDFTENWEGKSTHYVALIYTGEYVSGDLKPTDGNDDVLEVVDWYSKSEIAELPLSIQVKNQLTQLGVLE